MKSKETVQFESEHVEKEEMSEFENKILKREEMGEDVTKEKISLIEKLYQINYTEREKKEFDEWLEKIPKNSPENPIFINSADEVAEFLPLCGNYSENKVNVYFTKEIFSSDDLQLILENFSKTNRSFEISIVKKSDNLISIGIGNKARNPSTLIEGEYFGHYHPTQFEMKNKEELPDCFVMGLMPSAGDVRGFLNHMEVIKTGTRIFSKNGYIFLKPTGEMEDPSVVLKEFSKKYFNLFLGENKLGLKSDQEIAEYFKETFGIEIKFHYFNQGL